MLHSDDSNHDHHDPHDDHDLPDIETGVACLLSQMTMWAASCPASPLDRDAQRALLARKVVSNLFFLQHHPHLSPALRQVMAHAHQRWVALATVPAASPAAGVGAAAGAALWH